MDGRAVVEDVLAEQDAGWRFDCDRPLPVVEEVAT